jgi:hypothetical protein
MDYEIKMFIVSQNISTHPKLFSDIEQWLVSLTVY